MTETYNIAFSLSSIWSFVLAVIASLGGGAVIAGLVIKFSVDRVSESLQAKYQLKLDKEMERYKAEIDKTLESYKFTLGTKQHISVKRFDAEFDIYQNLTKTFFDAVRDCAIMVPAGLIFVPADDQTRLKMDDDNFNSALKSVVSAQDCLHSVIPFIPEEFYQEYKDILLLMNLQLNAYKRKFNLSDMRKNKEKWMDEDYQRTEIIDVKFQSLNQKVREYLNGLDIIQN